ncbi:hypothetical protein [Streptomyces sp. TRM68367]|uniref:hypothetical protein n=1 Tax=Streptomyces sp. TRM68367 TaxID=2758415 RepID=UPI00165CCEB4|nr:hypothetical protein [Streptomyces sp. TRM68367]MBC9728372.1 hypothetical protein [Streptomyces sp. TRM68367]
MGANGLTASCGARGALTLWLAAQSTAGTRGAYDSVAGHSSGGIILPVLNSASGLSFGPREDALARALLDRPDDATGKRVRALWDRLTATDTTVAEAARLLDVPAGAIPRVTGEEGLCR